jgi:GDP-4-dehydro-6-deoxy-D-mannose reductase
MRDGAAVRSSLGEARPDAIVHLAAVSSVAHSHADPVVTFETNALGTLHLCMAARAEAPQARILIISSGEVYGPTAPGHHANEDSPLLPTSPYAASKVAAEAIALQFARSYGLHVVCARPFAHLGAGQSSTFAFPSFARQLAEARSRPGRAMLFVGNLEPVRDFSHVKDVVEGYRLLLQRGRPREVYNVCSGTGRPLHRVLEELIGLSGLSAEIRVDQARVRPVDLPHLVGDPAKMRALGWQPRFTVEDALRDLLDEVGVLR